MPTARLDLLIIESDEVSRKEIREIEEAHAYVEKFDGGITLAGDATDVEIAPPQITASKVLVLTAEDGITVKLNDAGNTAMTGVTLMALAAEDLQSLFLSNPGSDPIKVRIHMYGDA